jgi:hypothetical protein
MDEVIDISTNKEINKIDKMNYGKYQMIII